MLFVGDQRVLMEDVDALGLQRLSGVPNAGNGSLPMKPLKYPYFLVFIFTPVA